LVENGEVVNIIVWDGESPLTFPDGITPAPVADGVFCGIGFGAEQDGAGAWTYIAPPAPAMPPPTPEQILGTNTATRNQYLAAAALAIAPLQDAVDIGEATADDTAMLTKWKQFRVAVNRVDLTLASPTWPAPPEAGWGASVTPSTDAVVTS